MIHGLGATPFDYLQHQLALFLVEHGYDVYRPWLYNGGQNARKGHACEFKNHVNDINTLLKARMFDGDRKPSVIGHSYGGLVAGHVAAIPNPNLRGVVMLDPTGLPGWQKNAESIDDNHYLTDWGMLVSKAYFEHAQTLAANPNLVSGLAQEIKVPMINILAGGDQKPGRVRDIWHKHAGGSSELVTIDGADHQFAYPGTFNPMAVHLLGFLDNLPK